MGYLVLPGESTPDDSSDASNIAKFFRVGLAALALAIAWTLAVTNPAAAGEVTAESRVGRLPSLAHVR